MEDLRLFNGLPLETRLSTSEKECVEPIIILVHFSLSLSLNSCIDPLAPRFITFSDFVQ